MAAPEALQECVELWRRCSAPQHAQHAGPHTYIPTSATGTPTEQHTTKTKHAPAAAFEEGGDGVVRGARVQNARLTCRAGHGFRGVGTAQPKTCRLERTEEGEAEPEGGRAALDCVTTNPSIRT